MKTYVGNGSWNWRDTFIFFLRTIWIIFFTVGVIIENPGAHTALLIVWFAGVYVVPSLFYRPGYKQIPLYLAAEGLLSGSLFLFLLLQSDLNGLASFLYVPVITIAFVCQQKPFLWIGPIICAAMFITGTLPGYEILTKRAGSALVDTYILYILGFAFGRYSVLNQKSKQLIKQIHHKNETLQQYASKIEELTIIEERNRVSREIHDKVGHIFTAVITSLDALPYQIRRNEGEAERTIKEMSELARKGLDDVRKTIHNMSPASHSDCLSKLCLTIVGDFNDYPGLRVDFVIKGTEIDVAERIKYTLVRCLQESLTAAIRYGKASLISVKLSFVDSVALQIIDDGQYSVEHELLPAYVTLKERLSSIGGEFRVQPHSEGGTQVICSVQAGAEALVKSNEFQTMQAEVSSGV
ncbi:sensor histidine kinase [Peribacillus sp. SCS-155]|uniref:sensor histidine kinase n=1 Tax=Peribacillus sedimenti TaxID=3115297 RepID=UPI00390688A9